MKTTPVSLSKTLLLVASALTLTICFSACEDNVVAPSPAGIHYQSGGDTVILSPIDETPVDTLPVRGKKPISVEQPFTHSPLPHAPLR